MHVLANLHEGLWSYRLLISVRFLDRSPQEGHFVRAGRPLGYCSTKQMHSLFAWSGSISTNLHGARIMSNWCAFAEIVHDAANSPTLHHLFRVHNMKMLYLYFWKPLEHGKTVETQNAAYFNVEWSPEQSRVIYLPPCWQPALPHP